ncbi:hypothetical protein MKW94_029171, partial [Papaver nudicaule]|nr:hypothetical protein [Papaver nudicaule]
YVTRIRLTRHCRHSGQPYCKPEVLGFISLSDMLFQYSKLWIPLHATMNIPFYHAARDEVSFYNIDSRSRRRTVGDMLLELKSKVQLSRPDAELRLLLIRRNIIKKVYPLNERLTNLPKRWPMRLRAEEASYCLSGFEPCSYKQVFEEEKCKGPRDKMIQVNHVNTEAFAGKINK